jgi:hypothetical protein
MMDIVSMDKALPAILVNKTYGYVHSVYAKVINLIADNRLIAVCCADMEPAPDTIIVNYMDSFIKLNIKSGDNVVIMENLIIVGEVFTIILKSCSMYDLSYLISCTNSKLVMSELLHRTEKLVIIYGTHSSLYNACFDVSDNSEMTRIFRNKITDIRKTNELRNIENVIDIVTELTGLGIGLTPSGDDFMAGFFLIILNWSPYLKDTISLKYKECGNKTGIIGRRMVENAIDNRARQSEKCLVRALFQQSWYEVKSYIHRVLNFGSSSGTDTMCGIVTALHVILISMDRE